MMHHDVESVHVFTYFPPYASHHLRASFIGVLCGVVLVGIAWCSLVAAQAPTPLEMGSALQKTATEAERYIKEHLFDPDGLMYSYIDVRTGKPFEEAYVAEFKENVRLSNAWSVHHRADRDPVTYWSYEDTVAEAGYYIQALVLKYEVTGDAKALEEAFAVWNRYKQVFYISQAYGIGNFLRPYGGYEGGFTGMSEWMEPLGSDQATALLTGQYALWKHAKGDAKKEIAHIAIMTLSWYERQDFRYVWYKSLVHTWDQGGHAGSYYLPAMAFAAKVTGDDKWSKLLQEKLPLAQGSGTDLMNTFKRGSDFVMLAELLGDDFEKEFPQEIIDSSYEAALEYLAQFTLPGMAAPAGSGARVRPEERGFYFLCGLVTLGHPGAAEKSLEVLSAPKKVPEDFTTYLSDDSDKLPTKRYVQLQARAVGYQLVMWYRNYWILRKATMAGDK